MSQPLPPSAPLLSSSAVRERAHEMFEAGLSGQLAHTAINLDRLKTLAPFVAGVIRENYPSLKVPLHARWRHFEFGGVSLWDAIKDKAQWSSRDTQARAAFDLAIVSVLLDAGAGAAWRYHDPSTGIEIGRSEGLALASVRMFEAGLFSADRADPYRADASKLSAITAADLARGFQVSVDNPLTGLEGRAALLARLGTALADNAAMFGINDTPRPGGLYDHLRAGAIGGVLPAPDILTALLQGLGPIWPGRIVLDGVSLGDTWRHPAIRRADSTNGLIPFHKLSQWLAYSLVEPLIDSGISVTTLDGLTGLAEYRNGGLFVDGGVIVLCDPAQAVAAHPVDSELVVEWRALTVALLDTIAPLVRAHLGVEAEHFPLGCVLEGGTWAAGRRLAKQLRPDSRPPINVVSDGTVF